MDDLGLDFRSRVRRVQAFDDGLVPAGERPLGKERCNACAGGRVWILIDRYVNASRTRLFDQLQSFDALAPIR